jgi:hypothetical protein
MSVPLETSRQEGWTTVWHRHARLSTAVSAESRVAIGAVKVHRRALAALVLCSGLVLAGIPAVAHAQGTSPSGCTQPAVGQISCAALVASGATAMTEAAVAASGTAPPGFSPVQLRYAYGLEFQALTGGVGQTVAVVTAYDDATAETDMGAYRSQYNLPACTTADGCFSKVNETGGDTYPPAGPAGSGWTLATAQALDMISAICPNCHILLVEATTTGITDLGTAENEAVSLGADFVANTWFTPEATYGSEEPTYDSEYFDHPGVVITAPDGNGAGYGTYYPAASPDVIAVGGTTLTQDPSVARGWSEQAWSYTGSGCSPYEPKPSWQTDTGCTTRTLNDTAAVADPNTPVAIYDTTSGDWVATGGNITAAAIIAAASALAGTPAADTIGASYLYANAGAGLVNNITSGSDGTCSVTYLCTAGPGYNGPTGVGTPASAAAFGAGAPAESLPGAPAAYNPVNGDQELLGTGTNGTEWADSPSSTSSTWSGTNLGGEISGSPSATFDPASDNLEVYARATNGTLEEDYWEAVNDQWSGWQNMGISTSAAPSAAYNPLSGAMDVFEAGDTSTDLRSWTATGGWSSWTNLGGIFSSAPAAAYDPATGSMQVFEVGTTGTAYVDSWTPAAGWSGFTNLGGEISGTPHPVYDPASGNLEVYARATNGTLEEDYWEAANAKWSGWQDMDAGTSAAPAAAYNPLDNAMDVFETGDTGTEFVRTWTATGGWSSWTNIGGDITGTVVAAYDPNSGALEVYGLGTNNAMYVDSWTPAGGWSGWNSPGFALGAI